MEIKYDSETADKGSVALVGIVSVEGEELKACWSEIRQIENRERK